MEIPSVIERIKYTPKQELLKARIVPASKVILERTWQQFGNVNSSLVTYEQVIDLFYAQALVALDNTLNDGTKIDEEKNSWETEFEQVRQALSIHTPEGKRFAFHLLINYRNYWDERVKSNTRDKAEMKRRSNACDYAASQLLDFILGYRGPLFPEYPLSEANTKASL